MSQSIFIRAIKKLRRILGLRKASHNNGSVEKYPYVHYDSIFDVRFVINNRVERFRLKEWGGEREYLEEIVSELNPDDILFDIGASVGLVSVIAAKRLRYGRVVSFEPDPENVQSLRGNYNANNLENVEIQNIAVADKTGKMTLYTDGSNGFSPSLKRVNGINRSIDVKVETIDDLLERGVLPIPTVMKIDIEGAELMALNGMLKLLKSSDRPRLIFMELHPEFLPSFGTSIDEVLKLVAGLDYNIVEKQQRDKQVLTKLVRT